MDFYTTKTSTNPQKLFWDGSGVLHKHSLSEHRNQLSDSCLIFKQSKFPGFEFNLERKVTSPHIQKPIQPPQREIFEQMLKKNWNFKAFGWSKKHRRSGAQLFSFLYLLTCLSHTHLHQLHIQTLKLPHLTLENTHISLPWLPSSSFHGNRPGLLLS